MCDYGEGLVADDVGAFNFTTNVGELREMASSDMGNLWTDLWVVKLSMDEPGGIASGEAVDVENAYVALVDEINARHMAGLDVIEAIANALRQIAEVYAIADGQD